MAAASGAAYPPTPQSYGGPAPVAPAPAPQAYEGPAPVAPASAPPGPATSWWAYPHMPAGSSLVDASHLQSLGAGSYGVAPANPWPSTPYAPRLRWPLPICCLGCSAAFWTIRGTVWQSIGGSRGSTLGRLCPSAIL
ncbi:hypothetical protein D1007_41610 [Hordeum vulgare]|nr:hypothetical protein D1007_41610 [Hordeum vulgare]